MVYLIAFIVALIAAFYNNRLTPTLRKSILITLCVYIIIIIGLRYKVGIDTISYMHIYKKIPSLEYFFSAKTFTMTRYEPGYLFVCCACKSFSNEFWPVQLVMAAITNGCIFVFLFRYCRNVFVGVLFYFIFQFLYFSTEILRESAAVSIFLLNYKNLQQKKWMNYYLLSIVSVLFHYSAIIIWFFPFVKLLKSNIVFYCLCAAFLVITPLVEKLNDILQIAAISGRIEQYVTAADDLNMNWRIAELLRTAFPAIATLIGYRIAKAHTEFRGLILLQILFCMGAFAIPLIFSRFSNYTTVFVITAAANLVSMPLQRWMKLLFVSFILLTQVNYYYTNYDRWIPYVSIFYPEDMPHRAKLYRHTFLPWLRYTR